jgi:LacI family transcriptional regulator
LGGDVVRSRHTLRFKALREALKQLGAHLKPEYCVTLDDAHMPEGRQAAKQLLEHRGAADFPTAWVCYNGMMARGAVNHLMQEQIAIPGEISVVAVDATRVCVEDEPHITGAAADPERMGAAAGELIMKSTGEEEEIFTDLTLPSKLTVRQTSGPAPSPAAPKAKSGGKRAAALAN